MKPNFIIKTTWTLLIIILAGIIIHAPLIVFVETRDPSLGLIVKAWKELLMLAIGILLAVELTRARQWKWLMHNALLVLASAFIVLHVLLLGFEFHGWQAAVAGLLIDLRYVVFFAEIHILLHLWPKYKTSFIKVAVAGAIVVVGFACLQLFLPHDVLSPLGYGKSTIMPYLTIDKNPLFVRENSTLRGPNPLGAYAACVLLFLVAYVRETWAKTRTSWRKVGLVLFVVAALASLVISYSRGAWVGCIIAGAVAAIWWLPNIKLWQWVSMAVLVLIVAVGVVSFRQDSFISNVVFHNNPLGSSKKSDTGHVSSLEQGTASALTRPLGNGIGSTGSASLFGSNPSIVENQYLFVLHEAGWLGLIVFLWLVGLVFWRLIHGSRNWLACGVILSGICLLIIGLVLPVWTDDTVSIVWWGLAAVALGDVQLKRERSSYKKAA